MNIRLSLCIATFNRAKFIGETLESILCQLSPRVEIVIVDGASTDDTQSVISPYIARYTAVRYFREEKNSGVDIDFDKAISYATGEYCWLFTDDDTLISTAVDQVLEALEEGDVDLLVVDAQVKDASLGRVLRPRRLAFSGVREYRPSDADEFLGDAGDSLSFIGGTIIKRRLWLERQRKPYFGSLFVHVGVVFQLPAIENIRVIGKSLVNIRYGNAMWRSRTFEIWGFMWPQLIWSFDGYSESAKNRVVPREPWRSTRWLFFHRAVGSYSITEYKRFIAKSYFDPVIFKSLLIAIFPGRLANLMGVLYVMLTGKAGNEISYDLVLSSRYSNVIARSLFTRWRRNTR